MTAGPIKLVKMPSRDFENCMNVNEEIASSIIVFVLEKTPKGTRFLYSFFFFLIHTCVTVSKCDTEVEQRVQ